MYVIDVEAKRFDKPREEDGAVGGIGGGGDTGRASKRLLAKLKDKRKLVSNNQSFCLP